MPGGRPPARGVAVVGASSRVACGGRRTWGCGYGDGRYADTGWQVKAATGVWQTEGGGHRDADTGDGGYADTGWQVKASDGVRQAEGGGGY